MRKKGRVLSVSHSTCGLVEAQPDPVGVLGRAALVCLAAALVAASLVQTGRTELSHTQVFSVVSLFYFACLVEAYYVREKLVSAVTGCFLPRL